MMNYSLLWECRLWARKQTDEAAEIGKDQFGEALIFQAGIWVHNCRLSALNRNYLLAPVGLML